MPIAANELGRKESNYRTLTSYPISRLHRPVFQKRRENHGSQLIPAYRIVIP